MKKFTDKEGNTFFYRKVEDTYVVITRYMVDSERMTFSKNENGYFVHRINVPETIEGLPVFAISSFKVRMKMYGDDGYRHNGSSFIELTVPEHIYFDGFDRFQTDGGYFYPNYRIVSYPRRNCKLLLCDKEGFAFYAKLLDDKSCSIVQIIAKNNEVCELRLPESIGGYSVISIAAESTYKLPESLSVIRLSDGIKEIGVNCFRNLPNLEKLYLGRETNIISNGCFYYYGEGNEEIKVDAKPLTVYYHKKPLCATLAFVRKGELWLEEFNEKLGWDKYGEKRLEYDVSFVSLSECDFCIEANVIKKCKSISSTVTVPNGVKAIADGAFSGNEFVENVVIPDSVKRIGAYAFKDCCSLKEISLPSGISEIGIGAFQNCKSLKGISIPDGVKTIEKCLCMGCGSIGDLKLPKSLETICEHAFEGCSVSTVDIPWGTKYIKYHAFAYCSKPIEITIPKTTESVDMFSFAGSTSFIRVK